MLEYSFVAIVVVVTSPVVAVVVVVVLRVCGVPLESFDEPC